MAREIDEAWIEEAIERYQRLERLLADFEKALAEVEVTVRSPGRAGRDGRHRGRRRSATWSSASAAPGSTARELSRAVQAAVTAAADAAGWAAGQAAPGHVRAVSAPLARGPRSDR